MSYENSTPAVVFEQLKKYFIHRHNAKHVDLFEDLGNYYTQELNNGHINGEAYFYKNLSTAFSQHKTATVASMLQTTQRTLMSEGCSGNGVGNEVLSFLTPFGKIAGPAGNVISVALGETQAIFNAACPAGQSSMQTSFDKINEKLDSIQESLKQLKTDVGALRAMITIQNADSIAVDMEKLYQDEIGSRNEYWNFIDGNNTESLGAFVAKEGGIDNLDRAVWNSVIFDSRDGLIGGVSRQNAQISILTSKVTLDRLAHELQSRCANNSAMKDIDGKDKDIIATTDMCDVQVIETGYFIAGLAQQARLRMLDAVNVINTSTQPTKFVNKFGVLWVDVPRLIDTDTESRMQVISDFMKNTMNSLSQPRKDLKDMNIDFDIPANCSTTKFEKTKVFPNIVKYKDEGGNEHKDSNKKGYDSITVAMSCDGKESATRVLLPGGQYYIESNNADKTSIMMRNAKDWEVNEKINPLIAPSAAVVSDSYVAISGHMIIKGAMGGQRLIPMACPDGGVINDINNYLKSQGRDLQLDSCTTNHYREHGDLKYADARYEIKDNMRTKLYIPLIINFDGYRTVAIWRNTGGLRVDYYGQADSSNLVRSYDTRTNNYGTSDNEFINIDGYRSFRNTGDNNIINIGNK